MAAASSAAAVSVYEPLRPKYCYIEEVETSGGVIEVTAKYNTFNGALCGSATGFVCTEWEGAVPYPKSLCYHQEQESHPYYVIADTTSMGNEHCDETTELCPQSECLEPEHHITSAEECIIAAMELLSGEIEFNGDTNYNARHYQIYCIGWYGVFDSSANKGCPLGSFCEVDDWSGNVDQYSSGKGTPCTAKKCSYMGSDCKTENDFSKKWDGDVSNGGGNVPGVYIVSPTDDEHVGIGYGCNFNLRASSNYDTGWQVFFNSNEGDKGKMLVAPNQHESTTSLICNHEYTNAPSTAP